MDDETKWKYFPFSPEAPYWLNQYNRKCDLSCPLAASDTVVGGKFFTRLVQNTFIVSKREKTHITRTRINVKTSTMNISLILIAIRTASSRGELKGLANLLFKKYIETKNQ